MNNDPRGTIIQQGNVMRIDNALVEDVFCYDNKIGHILVSYAVPRSKPDRLDTKSAFKRGKEHGHPGYIRQAY